jgi:DnaK suppressor protein
VPPGLAADDIEQLRQHLKTQQQELQALVDHTEDDAQPVTLDQQSVGRVSRIDAIQQQQMAIANQQQANARLAKIERALARIETEEYGYCLECGDIIATARLQAQPFAELCIDCQQSHETG